MKTLFNAIDYDHKFWWLELLRGALTANHRIEFMLTLLQAA
jgi:hypothetical protein